MFERKVDAMQLRQMRCESKQSAKMIALSQFPADIDKAEKLYDFLVKDMDLPDFDPIKPSGFSQVRSIAVDTFSWVKNNKDEIGEIIGVVRGLIGKNQPIQPANVPPLNM